MSVTGFTVIHNGNKLGYPWLESILAVLPHVDCFLIGEGYSSDDTLWWCYRLQTYSRKVKVMRQLWPASVTGFAIGKVTNEAMDMARHTGSDWLWLVQSDELYGENFAIHMRQLMDTMTAAYDAIDVPFLHLQNNYQELQAGAGYTRAVRAVRNYPHIKSYRDAWTFTGYQNALAVPEDDYRLVHANRTYWHNIPLKMRSHADILYPDLDHYRVSAEEAERLHASEQIPEIFQRTVSPYAEYLPAVILPTIGQLAYEPRAELLEEPT